MEEDLKQEIKNIKADSYDMEEVFKKYQEEQKRRIAELEEKITSLQNDKAKEDTVEEKSDLTNSEEFDDKIEIVPNSEPVVAVPENKNEEQNIQAPQENVLTPLIPVEEKTEVTENVVDTQPVEQVSVESNNIEIKENTDAIYNRVDSNAPRAIIVNSFQGDKLRKSKDINKSIALGDKKEEQQIEIPKGEELSVEPLIPTISIEGEKLQEPVTESNNIDKQLQDMIDQLKTTTDEAKAAELNNKISELSKAKELTKTA